MVGHEAGPNDGGKTATMWEENPGPTRFDLWNNLKAMHEQGKKLDYELGEWLRYPPWSTDIGEAFELVELITGNEALEHPLYFKMTHRWFPTQRDTYRTYAAFDWKMTGDRNPLYQATGDSIAHAICLAILKIDLE